MCSQYILCNNNAEEEIYSLYHIFSIIIKTRNKIGKTNYFYTNLVAYISMLLLIKLLSYLDVETRYKSRTVLYNKNGRNYSDDDKEAFSKFVEKYKNYRNCRLAHYNILDCETPQLTEEEINEIIERLFQYKIFVNDGVTSEGLKNFLYTAISIGNHEVPCLLSLKEEYYHKLLDEGNVLINKNDIIKFRNK